MSIILTPFLFFVNISFFIFDFKLVGLHAYTIAYAIFPIKKDRKCDPFCSMVYLLLTYLVKRDRHTSITGICVTYICMLCIVLKFQITTSI